MLYDVSWFLFCMVMHVYTTGYVFLCMGIDVWFECYVDEFELGVKLLVDWLVVMF